MSISGSALINAMKGALGDILDPAALQAMEVSKAMAAAGASKEEIEEMMAVILNRGGTVSQEFLEAIKEVMELGGNKIYIQLVWQHTYYDIFCQINLNIYSTHKCNFIQF